MLKTISEFAIKNHKFGRYYKLSTTRTRYYHKSNKLFNKVNQNAVLEKHGSVNAFTATDSVNAANDSNSTKLSTNNNSLNRDNSNSKVKSTDLIKTLSEQLILETNLNLHKPTRAENQFSTLQIFNTLLLEGKFNSTQSDLITQLIIFLLNDHFFNDYNDKFLRDFEINKQKHLYNALTNEIKFDIDNSRNLQFLQIRKRINQLEKNLNNFLIEINELTSNKLNEECKLDLNQHIIDNKLLFKKLHSSLNDLNNKITKRVAYDIKSEIENLRWHATRMWLLAIILMTFMVLTAINVISRKKKKLEEDKNKTYIENSSNSTSGLNDNNHCISDEDVLVRKN